jgi:hypothetical protein
MQSRLIEADKGSIMDPPTTANPQNQTRWNFAGLLAALLIGFLFQSVFLPCLCDIGTAKIALAYSFDGLVLLRMLVAYIRSETGKGWVFYAALCYTSVAWIEGITYLVLGDT